MPASGTDQIIKATCPQCGPTRNHVVRSEIAESYSSSEYGEETKYRIIACCGCEHIQFQTSNTNSEDIDYDQETGECECVEHISYFPAIPNLTPPAWINEIHSLDRDIYRLYVDTYAAANSDSSVLATMGIRAIFDSITTILGIGESGKFESKLTLLKEMGVVTSAEHTALQLLVEIGHGATHELGRPQSKDLDLLFTILNNFAHAQLVNPHLIEALNGSTVAKARAAKRELWKSARAKIAKQKQQEGQRAKCVETMATNTAAKETSAQEVCGMEPTS